VSKRPGVQIVQAAATLGVPGKYVADEREAAADLFLELARNVVTGTIATGCDPADAAAILYRLADDAEAEARRRAALKPPTSRGAPPLKGLEGLPPRRRPPFRGL
jgi:hypothetical protein